MSESRRIPLEELGEAFLTHIVTPERIRAALEKAVSRPFEVGPLRPIAIAPVVANASGRVVTVTVERVGTRGDFAAEIRATFDLAISIAGIEHRYTGEITVRLRLHIGFEKPLVLVAEIDRPQRGDIDVALAGDTSRAELLKIIGNVRAEVARAVAKLVNAQVESERGLAARRIDIAGAVDLAWSADTGLVRKRS